MGERDQNLPINSTDSRNPLDSLRDDLERMGFYDEHLYPANIGFNNNPQSRRPASLPTTPSPTPPKP